MDVMERITQQEENETLFERSLRFRQECAAVILQEIGRNPQGVYSINLYRTVEAYSIGAFGPDSYNWERFSSHLTWLQDESVLNVSGDVVTAA